mgnify:CR=1 FL=1
MYVILPPQSRLLTRALLLTVGLYASSLSLGAQEADNSPSSPSIGAKATAPLALTLEQAVRLALDKSPSLQAVRLGSDEAKVNARKTRAGLLPSVSLTGSYSYMLKKQKVYFGGGDSGGGVRGGLRAHPGRILPLGRDRDGRKAHPTGWDRRRDADHRPSAMG